MDTGETSPPVLCTHIMEPDFCSQRSGSTLHMGSFRGEVDGAGINQHPINFEVSGMLKQHVNMSFRRETSGFPRFCSEVEHHHLGGLCLRQGINDLRHEDMWDH